MNAELMHSPGDVMSLCVPFQFHDWFEDEFIEHTRGTGRDGAAWAGTAQKRDMLYVVEGYILHVVLTHPPSLLSVCRQMVFMQLHTRVPCPPRLLTF